jgi:SNF2 family DNA or RNA helicase
VLLLQASWYRGALAVWGESPTETRVRKSRSTALTPYPYAAPIKALTDALQQALGDQAGKPVRQDAVLWLPASNGAPIPSSSLIADVSASADSEMRPYTLTALILTPADAIALLTACVGRDTLGPGLVIGSTLLAWAQALRFAGALVAQQRYLPSLRVEEEGYAARWEPFITGADSDRLNGLAHALPGACRALTDAADTPPIHSSIAVLTEFVRTITDQVVRASSPQPPHQKLAFDSVHAQWIYRLTSSRPLMMGSPQEMADLRKQIRDWRRPLDVTSAAPARLCFRLEEPLLEGDETEGEWFVRLLLQPMADPSLFVPMKEAWSGRGPSSALLRAGGAEPHEYLLALLGQASHICPELEAALQSPAAEGYALDLPGAQTFLAERAWLLEQSGFVVQLPSWWSRKGQKTRLASRASVKAPKMQSNSGLGMETLVDFDWQVALGGQTLTLQELEALAAQKSSLVRFRGQWVQLDAKEIETALNYWKKHGSRQIAAGDVVRMAIGAEKAPGGLEIEGIEATGWIADLLDGLSEHAAFADEPMPEDFDGDLRPYQQRGYSWLQFLTRWGLGACLADDMGLGKTCTTLAAIARRWERQEHGPTLVICPTSVVGNWQREAQRFTPDLPVMIHHGLKRSRDEEFVRAASEHAIVLSSFALLHRDFELLQKVAWSGIVLDEAQNIKNPETRQSRAARALKSDWRIALTGTPVENHVGDLWSIMEFLNAGLLGTQTEFKRNYFTPIQTGSDPTAADRLKRITQPFILRRLKTDRSIITDLPDKQEMKTWCTLTSEQATLYRAVVREAEEALEEAEGMSRRGLVLATLMKLKQVCNHPAQLLKDNSEFPGRSGKVARLTEMLEEVLEAGDRALIFTQFSEMGEMLRPHLQETFGKETLFLHGGVTKTARDRMVARFQTEGEKLPFFILSLKAGGVGLNLTGANHVFHFDRWWNPAVENQATDRAFRIGQTKGVMVHKFLCAGTLEERIDEMIERKRAVASAIVGTGEGWLTELSTAELKALFALRPDAVA